jgi:epoxyqueuosine reductase
MNDTLGSFFNIGIILTSLEISPDDPSESKCKNCNLCIKNCPTNAIVSPSVIDCNLCISNYTIEKISNPNPLLDVAIKQTGYCFGCDICQNICPYNSQLLANVSDKKTFVVAKEITAFSESDFITIFSNYPVSRSGYSKFIRNIGLALE